MELLRTNLTVEAGYRRLFRRSRCDADAARADADFSATVQNSNVRGVTEGQFPDNTGLMYALKLGSA